MDDMETISVGYAPIDSTLGGLRIGSVTIVCGDGNCVGSFCQGVVSRALGCGSTVPLAFVAMPGLDANAVRGIKQMVLSNDMCALVAMFGPYDRDNAHHYLAEEAADNVLLLSCKEGNVGGCRCVVRKNRVGDMGGFECYVNLDDYRRKEGL